MRGAPRPRLLLALMALPALGSVAGCGSTATSAYVRVPPAEPPSTTTRVARLVGELLGSDPDRSAEAERRLLVFDESEREELARLAATIPTERDPRWLHVLDELHLGPALRDDERVAFLLWKAARPETFFASKARAALAEQARVNPAPLLAALEAGQPGAGTLAVALALADCKECIPALTERYVASEDEGERRALVEALARLLGEETLLRPTAPRDEREREAARLREHFLLGTPRKPEAPREGDAPADG